MQSLWSMSRVPTDHELIQQYDGTGNSDQCLQLFLIMIYKAVSIRQLVYMHTLMMLLLLCQWYCCVCQTIIIQCANYAVSTVVVKVSTVLLLFSQQCLIHKNLIYSSPSQLKNIISTNNDNCEILSVYNLQPFHENK